jgi:hypothetical protein
VDALLAFAAALLALRLAGGLAARWSHPVARARRDGSSGAPRTPLSNAAFPTTALTTYVDRRMVSRA